MSSTPFHLSGKHILVTGASSGIGASVAVVASQLGAQLTITGRNEDRLQEVANLLEGGGHRLIVADLCDSSDRDHLVDGLLPLDGVVHAAGMVQAFPIKYIQEKQLKRIREINYDAPVLLTSSLLSAKKIVKGASFVFISSIAAQYTHKGGAIYAGAKAAINAYSKTLALECADREIRSNTIMAAMVHTPLFDQVERAIGKEQMDKHGLSYPLGFGRAEDVAHATIFLLSGASRWITGTELLMDGGLTAGS